MVNDWSDYTRMDAMVTHFSSISSSKSNHRRCSCELIYCLFNLDRGLVFKCMGIVHCVSFTRSNVPTSKRDLVFDCDPIRRKFALESFDSNSFWEESIDKA